MSVQPFPLETPWPAQTQEPVRVARIPGQLLIAGLAAASLALTLPLATAVWALVLGGVAHNLQELRYLARRYAATLAAGAVLRDLLWLTGGIMLLRGAMLLQWIPDPTAKLGEIALLYLLLGRALSQTRMRTAGWWLLAGAVGIALAASLRWPQWHFLVLTHLHNLVPWFFLSVAVSEHPGVRRWLGGIGVGVFVLLPAGILLGAFDALGARDGLVLGEAWLGFARRLALPEWHGTLWAARLLTCFAYLQLVHFAIWIAILPRLVPATEPAEAPRLARIAADPRVGTAIGVLVIVTSALFIMDFQRTQYWYPVIATWHAYLELPLLFLLLHTRR